MAEFIATQRVEHEVPHSVSCRAFGISQAWFYKWQHGDTSVRRARRTALAAQIRHLFLKHKRRYGSPRITADLKAEGWQVSVNTVAALMAEQQLVARPRHAAAGLPRSRTPRRCRHRTWCGVISRCETGRTRPGWAT